MKWRKTPFPLYDSIHDLVVGTVATGEGVFRPGIDYTPPSSPSAQQLGYDFYQDKEDKPDESQPSTDGPDINQTVRHCDHILNPND